MKNALIMLLGAALLPAVFLWRACELSSIRQKGVEGVFYPSEVLAGWTKSGSTTYRVEGSIGGSKAVLAFKKSYPETPVRIVYDRDSLNEWLVDSRGSFYDFYEGTKEDSPLQLEITELGGYFWPGVGVMSFLMFGSCWVISDEWRRKIPVRRRSAPCAPPAVTTPTKPTSTFRTSGSEQVHEPVRVQMAELRKIYPPPVADTMLNGQSCDEVSGAVGSFGKCLTNPIPVNGLVGTFKYFGKLRVNYGEKWGIYFHRICSAISPISDNRIDVYETVSIDGETWDILFVDIYHPRRSNRHPDGYFLTPYDELFNRWHFCYGCDEQLMRFPNDLPIALERNNFPAHHWRGIHPRNRPLLFEILTLEITNSARYTLSSKRRLCL